MRMPGARRKRTAMGLRRRSFLAAVSAAAVAPSSVSAGDLADDVMPSPAVAGEAVRAEFLHAWNGYKRAAWGRDEVRPVSGTAHDFFIPGYSFGLSIVEALDTLYVMGLDDDLARSMGWILKNLNFDVYGEVQMFETNIRMVGGLLAGYYATGEKRLLDLAHDLGDRLLPCFTKSPSGAPYRYVNLRTGAVRDPKMNLAEIGTNVLEFGDLSRLTGDPKYLNASLHAYEAVIAKRSQLNLLATYFDVEKGEFTSPEDVAPNEPADSFYEYLWGGWQMLGLQQCRDWYRMLTDAILAYSVDRANGQLWFATVDYRTGEKIDHTQSELAAFYAELVAKGGDRQVGSDYYDAFTTVLRRYEIIPEGFDYRTLGATDDGRGNALRPEYANAACDLWFLTHDQKYRDTAWSYFTAMRDHCRVANGYTVVKDVTTRPMTLGDSTPGYAFAENFKYLYLMFATTPRFDPSTYYMNTEGKLLRGLVR
jgi:mannosyl-oligosaccharide alpha-1,2-mannosidase